MHWLEFKGKETEGRNIRSSCNGVTTSIFSQSLDQYCGTNKEFQHIDTLRSNGIFLSLLKKNMPLSEHLSS